MSTLVAGRTFPWVRRSSAGGPVQVDTDTPKPQWRLAVRAFSRDRMAVVSLVMLVIVTLAAVFAPLLTPYSPTAGDPVDRLAGIGTEGHLLGLDGQGRDIWTRLLYGGRNSLLIGIGASIITMVFATLLGLLSGFFGGWLDWIISRCFDVMWAFPVILLGVALGVSLNISGITIGPLSLKSGSLWIPTVIIGIAYVVYLARPIRGQVLALREKEFVEAARAQGMGPWRIMLTELLPNLASTLLVFFPLIVANAILLEAALSFLGAGVQPPEPSWGLMISEGIEFLTSAPHLTIAPGIMLVLTVLALNIFGEGVRDALDPRAKIRLEH